MRTVREGRAIYGNLQRAVLFLVAFHIPIIGLAIASPLLGLPLLLLPVHLVWLELIVHPVAALVFEAEPAPADLMTRPPRPPTASVLPRRLLARSVISGAIVAAGALALYVIALPRGEDIARGAALAAVILGGLGLAWAERAQDRPGHRVPTPRTARFWIVMGLAAASLPLAFQLPPLALAYAGVPALGAALAIAAGAVVWRAGGIRP